MIFLGGIDISGLKTYKQALDFLQTPSPPGSTLGLDVINCLLEQLGNPHYDLKFVHVAGTTGKGSTCAFISSILRCAGYKTGLFISPVIQEFNEQIQISGEMISNEEIICLANELADILPRVQEKGFRRPSTFELITAMAFMHFKKQACDIVVLETGLGGRLDATNSIKASEVSVITNIGLDHTDILGDTLEIIAAEKAGIIKDNSTVVLYAQSQEVESVIRLKCQESSSKLIVADGGQADVKAVTLEGSTFDYQGYKELKINLAGLYQISNAVTAINVAEALSDKGFKISEAAIRNGLCSAYWPGRFELMRTEPFVIVDGAHNPQKAQALINSLSVIFPNRKITFVFGVLADKDYESIIKLTLPLAKSYYTISPPNDRALDSSELAGEIKKHTPLPVYVYDDISAALQRVMYDSSVDDIVCIFGSLYQVGEIRKFFGRIKF